MISFVIPTRNEEKELERTLEHLKKYKGEKEIIVADGWSTDNTVEIARKHADIVVMQDKTLYEKNIAGGRNAGAHHARGEFIVFFDADVRVFDQDKFFEHALGMFERNKKLVGLTSFLRVFPEEETFMDRLVFNFSNYLVYVLNIIRFGAALGEFQMIRADVFRKLGGYDEKYVAGEDQEMFRRLARAGRTRSMREFAYHTGRRAHIIGWPKLLWQWTLNGVYTIFLKRAKSKEWEVIR